MPNPYVEPPVATTFKELEKLDPEEAKKEARLLSEAIEYHNHLYYVENAPALEDATFDELFRRLQALEKAFPELRSEDSPTQRVGSPPVAELRRVDHYAPMLSLNSAAERPEIENFLRFVAGELSEQEFSFVLEPKLDGLSVEVVYREGTLKRGATRGDGRQGEEITRNIRTIGALPLRLRESGGPPSFLVVRGEVFVSKSGFEKLNERRARAGEQPFANPRNAAAGSVRQLHSTQTAEVPLDIFFYEVLESDGELPDSHWELLRRFPSWGLKTNPMNRRASSVEEMDAYYREILKKREELDYEIDGIVIKLDQRSARERLGYRNRSPRWAMAWKFPPRRKTTTLQDITVQVGRTGILTPVALLEPVTIGGATVSRASLHNGDEVARKDLRPGDRVRVERAGDVIPEVVEVVDPDRRDRPEPFSMPERCPACGTEVQREGAYHLCPAGLTCPPQLQGALEHFVSREAMDIENLGEKNIEQLVRRGLVRSVADLYTLSTEELKELDGFAEQSARKVREAIEGSKNPPLDRLIYALGIRHVGTHVALLLAESFGSLHSLMEAGVEEIRRVQEIGPETAESVASFFSRRENREVIDRLFSLGVQPREVGKAPGAQPLSGKNFVVTGTLDRFSRKEVERRIEELGGRVTASVSGNTDYLLLGTNPGSKLDQAREEGTSIIREEEFLRMIGEKK
ncbi:MAG: NAD-dependent DNA ligase LigA [Spirochaetaceae bacterium]